MLLEFEIEVKGFLLILCIFVIHRLTPEDIKDDAIIPLKFVKFQNVLSLTVSPPRFYFEILLSCCQTFLIVPVGRSCQLVFSPLSFHPLPLFLSPDNTTGAFHSFPKRISNYLIKNTF